jgi:hypothetical protein
MPYRARRGRYAQRLETCTNRKRSRTRRDGLCSDEAAVSAERIEVHDAGKIDVEMIEAVELVLYSRELPYVVLSSTAPVPIYRRPDRGKWGCTRAVW